MFLIRWCSGKDILFLWSSYDSMGHIVFPFFSFLFVHPASFVYMFLVFFNSRC
jgi:hypothetical protein